REEADAIREGLNELERAMDMETEDQQAKEEFLNMFPGLKLKLEERIRKLYELADEIDRVHKNCTISNIVAGSTGIISGLLTLIGLGLAPFTAGASLTLSAAGAGLGAASAVTQVSTSIVESSSESSTIAEASRLTSTDIDEEEVIEKVVCPRRSPLSPLECQGSVEAVEDPANCVHGIKAARATPHLVVNAQRILRGESVSVQHARQVRNAFGGTALSVARGARIVGAATSSLFLAMDVFNLVKDSGHLQEGAKTESAEELRQQARELESKLEELTKIYESL
ncbi:hypothetical protein PANDA_022033, partial [Ailuropoda melanoleuca]